VDIVGCSIGGWIAAEIATKTPERIKRLVLIGPVGVKTGSPDKLDIPEMFGAPQDRLAKLLFHDPEKFRPDLKSMSDEAIATMVRNRETLALIAWEPYFHNPKLKYRLHRVTAPALFIRGESDGLISGDYLKRYAALLPNARIETIAKAGHAPQVEQPQALMDLVGGFLSEKNI
jgi:pimeloyl-ACP methyl ester carboxylesterase